MVWRLNRHAETKEGLDIVVEDPWHMEEEETEEDLVVGEEEETKEDVWGRRRIEWAGCRRDEDLVEEEKTKDVGET